MFEGKSILLILNSGGGIMYILTLCSVITIAVILQKTFRFMGIKKYDRKGLLKSIKEKILTGDIEGAKNECLKNKNPYSNVFLSGLCQYGKNDSAIDSAMERMIAEEVLGLEEYTTIIGTIGNTAVYIGLFGTVIGIMKAFHNISVLGQAGMNTVIAGVSEALTATATGLLVAIPSVIAFNYFITRIERITKEMQLCASELSDYLKHG